MSPPKPSEAVVMTRLTPMQFRQHATKLIREWPFELNLRLEGNPSTLDDILDRRDVVAADLQLALRTRVAKAFGFPNESFDIDVEIIEGSIWVKIKLGLQTLALIMTLYGGAHQAAKFIPGDLKWLREQFIEEVQSQTGTTVVATQENYSDPEQWQALFGQLAAIHSRRARGDDSEEESGSKVG